MKSLTNEQRAYLAGFFDGEGSFCIAVKVGPKGQRQLAPFVEVTSTNQAIIKMVADWIGEGFIIFRPKKGNANDAYLYQITGHAKIIALVDALLPYLVLKKPVAQHVRDFCNARNGILRLPRPQRGYTLADISRVNAVRRLNHRGRVPQRPDII